MTTTQQIRGAALALALAALAAGPVQVQADPAADAAAAIDKAEAARKKAASVRGEWRDTGQLIKDAQAAAQKGDHAEAQRLANLAFREGELGYQQATSQKNADFPAYWR